MVTRRTHLWVPGDLGVQMAVEVDEARRDMAAFGVDHPPGTSRVDRADSGDAVAVHRHVGAHRHGPGAVHHRSARDHQIVCHVRPLGVEIRATVRHSGFVCPKRVRTWWPISRVQECVGLVVSSELSSW